MQQFEGIMATCADRKELERRIKELEFEIEKSNEEWAPHRAPETPAKIRELRQLRRMR